MKTYPLLQSQLGVFYDCMKFPQVMQYNVPCITPLSDNPDLVTLLRPLMAYNMSGSHQMRWIESTNDYTTQVLYRLGFQWPPTAADYVHRFVDTIVGFDYFTV